jgi:hypothetical protein
VEALPLFTDSFDHNVNVRTGRVGAQRDHMAVLEREFLPGEIRVPIAGRLSVWLLHRAASNQDISQPSQSATMTIPGRMGFCSIKLRP